MQCPNCGRVKVYGSRFCYNCGLEFATVPQTDIRFNIFKVGGYGDGFYTSFGMKLTEEEALKWQNSPVNLSVNQDVNHFLGEVTVDELGKGDLDKHITARFRVHHWWKLVWNGTSWEKGEEILPPNRPESVGLSPLE